MPTSTLQPCGCCKTTSVDPHTAPFDNHLEAHVCADCRKQLLWAAARLKQAGLPHCSKVAKS